MIKTVRETLTDIVPLPIRPRIRADIDRMTLDRSDHLFAGASEWILKRVADDIAATGKMFELDLADYRLSPPR